MGPRDAPVVVLQRGGMSRARGQTPFGYVEYKYEALEERGLTPLAKGLALKSRVRPATYGFPPMLEFPPGRPVGTRV